MKKIKCVDLFKTKLILDIFLMLGYYCLVEQDFLHPIGEQDITFKNGGMVLS